MTSLLKDRRVWLGLAAVAVVLGLRLTGIGEHLSIERLREHRGTLTAWVGANGLLAALAYMGLYAAAVAFSLPGAAALTLAGGFFFGAALGTALAVVAATVGATLVFLFARSVLGEKALDGLGETAARLAEGIRRNAASYLLVLRLVPLFPFFLVNLVPAFVGVPLATFAATTFFGIIPGTAVFALAGSGLGEILDRGGELTVGSVLTPGVVAGLLGLAALSLAAIPIRKRLAAGGGDAGK
jgi:uncharacterized membrane protein YdjX (TVP38/TMEM64 family)